MKAVKLLILLCLALILLTLGLRIVYPFRHVPPQSSSDDPRLTYATPFTNVRPGVHYVGDSVCAQCHLDQAQTFAKHSMGQSLAPASAKLDVERLDTAAHNPFAAAGLHYEIEARDGHLLHREVCLDPGGRPAASVEAEVSYVLGSGARGRSYLVEREGRLFQSPISWYGQKKIWDLAPGYVHENEHFERPISAGCLFCHSNAASPVENTINRFETPIFHGYAIGCERCHGPGELHVQLRQSGQPVTGVDYTVVNPAQLQPDLREAVCQQCHLQGQSRTLRRGRKPFDFRPGLPYELFWTVFVSSGAGTDGKAVGQVEQMYVSRCFRASDGKLGCISCHNPHETPAPARKIAFYRGRCLTCHGEKGCSLPLTTRLEQSKEDSCIQCHMPRLHGSDVAHTAMTDHRVPRRPSAAAAPADGAGRTMRGELPTVHFHASSAKKLGIDVGREKALMLIEVAHLPIPDRQRLGRMALPLLETATKQAPDDLPALEGKAYALWLRSRNQEALALYEAILAKVPGREISLVDAATLAEQLDRHDQARGYWERAVSVNPVYSEYHFELARLLARRGDWEKARDECQATVRLDLANEEARKLLIRGYLHTASPDKARAELDVLLALFPARRDELHRWFAEQAH